MHGWCSASRAPRFPNLHMNSLPLKWVLCYFGLVDTNLITRFSFPIHSVLKMVKSLVCFSFRLLIISDSGVHACFWSGGLFFYLKDSQFFSHGNFLWFYYSKGKNKGITFFTPACFDIKRKNKNERKNQPNFGWISTEEMIVGGRWTAL